MKISLNDGKFEIIYNENPFEFKALRYGEEWKDLTGDDLILSLVMQLNEYQKLLKDIYLKFLRFDNAINSKNKDKEELNISYTWLDAGMSQIFDEIGELFKEERNN